MESLGCGIAADCLSFAICTAADFTGDTVRHEDLIQANLLQNTSAYCTPVVERAERVLRLKTIVVDNKTYEVSVYCVPDDSSGRGVIRGVDLRLDRDTIQAELQDNRNPPIVGFRRLGNTTAVLITFAQPQVPTWVYFCNSRHRCNLFKKKYEVCYRCGELGHRADVCASPTTKCRGCLLSDPPNDHTCKPICRLCGKEHLTGDSRCKEIFRTPYTVKRRHWEHTQRAEADRLKTQEPNRRVPLQHTSRWDRQRSDSEQRQPRADRALFHRSSLPLHGGGLEIPPGPDPSHLQASSRLGPLLNCCSHPSHHYQRQSNENINNRPPRAHKDVFGPLFLKAQQLAQGQPLLILGDFNAHHRAWGYHYDSAKGRRLWDDWHTYQLTLITDVSYPTRLGTGLHRDTTPDLAFTSSGVKATWCHTHENFGSDHFMVEIVIQEPTRQRTRPAQVIDWDSFRVHRQEQDTPPIITDIKAWTTQIVKQVAHATQTVELEDTAPHCDRHYAHLWERKKSLEALLATRKWDRNIRRPLARANTTIENYAIELTRQSWHNICDQMNKTPNTRNTWKLLRHLLDPAGGKLQARQHLERIFHHDGQIEETLQTAIDRVGDYLDTVGLTCSATKSEYIIIPSPGRRPPKILPELTLRVQGNCIPRTDHIRILGLHLQANGSNNISLQRIDQSVVQIGRLLKRVSNKHRGMRESNLLCLVQAFICSRITYSAPYLRLTRAESERLEASLRKAYKTALGLAMSTATHKLMALGISNTVNELIEATLTAQYERLSLTHAGRAVLQQVGISPTRAAPSYADLAPEYRQSLRIPPIPKRMHPEHHAERRADRARQLEKRFSGRPDVTYTDACYHHSKPAMVAVALAPRRSWHTACSIRYAETVTVAEEVAIALALTDPITEVVISDSQQAIRNYDAGRISRHALHILLSAPPSSSSRLLI
ncbi:hypothetical protein ISCGN_009559 [Ixodes scapularis]